METKISNVGFDLYYGNNHALKNIILEIYENQSQRLSDRPAAVSLPI